MPLAIDQIQPGDSIESVRAKISRTIASLIKNEGKTSKEAAGQAYGMAEQKWGKKIPQAN